MIGLDFETQTLDSQRIKALYDNRIRERELRMPRARITRKNISIIGTDGPSALDDYPVARMRYAKAGIAEEVAQESMAISLLKMGGAVIVSNLLKTVFTPGTSGYTPATLIVRPLEQYTYAVSKIKLPWFANRYGFITGPSKAEKYYTLIHSGKEYAFCIQKKGQSDFTVPELIERADAFLKSPMAIATDNKRVNNEVRDDRFVLSGALNRYTHGDAKEALDPRVVAGKIAKKNLFLSQQYGNFTEINIGGGMKVRKYEMPSKLRTWPFYEIGNLVYDATDILFYGALQRLFGRGASREISIDQEIRMHDVAHNWVYKMFSPSGRTPLEHYT